MKNFLFVTVFMLTSILSAQSLSNDLKLALRSDDAKAFSKLIAEGNLNACFDLGNSSYTLLALTIKLDAVQCFKTLIEKGVDLEKACSSKTPLMYTAKYGNLDMAKALIKAGADLKTENYKGRTALDYAKKYEQKEIYEYLKSIE